MKVIQVTYHGPTNRLPARFIAEDTCGLQNHRVVVKADSPPEPEKAARDLCRKMGWNSDVLVGGRLTSHRYVFVLAEGWMRKGE